MGDDVRRPGTTATLEDWTQWGTQRNTGRGAIVSHKLQEGGEEAIEGTLQGTLDGARGLLGRRLALGGCNGPHKVLHDEILRRLRTDEHAARRTGVVWVRRRANHDCDLTLDVAFAVRREVRASKSSANVPRNELLWVVCGVFG